MIHTQVVQLPDELIHDADPNGGRRVVLAFDCDLKLRDSDGPGHGVDLTQALADYSEHLDVVLNAGVGVSRGDKGRDVVLEK